MAATKKKRFLALLVKKSYSYKSKRFVRVLDPRVSNSDVCLIVTLTGNAILENQIWPPVKIEFSIIVWSVRGVLRKYCADLSTTMKIGTLVVCDLLNSNLPWTRSKFSMGVAILDNSKWPPPIIFFLTLLVQNR